MPDKVAGNDLCIFRVILSLLASACERTKGPGMVKLRVSVTQMSELLFQCEDAASPISDTDAKLMFLSSRAEHVSDKTLEGLHFIVPIIKSLGGAYGYRPKSSMAGASDETGSVFWFKVPVVFP